MGATRLWAAMHAGFFLLLGASLFRYAAYHGTGGSVYLLAVALAGVYAGGVAIPARARAARIVWLAAVIGIFLLLVWIAPSFAWCAIPLFFVGLHELPRPAVVPMVAVLTLATIAAQLRLAARIEPSLILGPIGVAAVATVVYLELDRQNRARQDALDEMLLTRAELGRSQREAGVLMERERLAREIHDTLAQGLSSMNLLLQAADRDWRSQPDQAREHVRQAAAVSRDNLAEARRFVHDLAPPGLDDTPLTEALRRLCAQAQHESGIPVSFTVAGEIEPLPVDVEVALLRIAQGALANLRQHARAERAAVTISYATDAVTLDVYDDGVGFDPATASGFGLSAIRSRAGHLGGTLTVESAPGEGTALAVAIPLGPSDEGHAA